MLWEFFLKNIVSSEYLISDNKIIIERFTNNYSDYTKDDFINSLNHSKKTGKKDYFYNEYVKVYNILNKYLSFTKEIIKIQSLQRKK